MEKTNKIPEMLMQYIDGATYGVTSKEPTAHTASELLEYAQYVQKLDKMGEWWGFSMYEGSSPRKQRAELTRFINKLKRDTAERKQQ